MLKAVTLNPDAYAAVFGTGADGDVTISSGTTTLTRDMCYRNLTISGTGRLATAGFRVYVSQTLDLSAAPTSAIVAFAGALSAATAAVGATGGATSAIFPGRMLPPSDGSANAGKNGGTGIGTAGTAPAASAFMQLGGRGGASKAGGASTNAGGAAAAQGTVAAVLPQFPRIVAEFVAYQAGPGTLACPQAGGMGASGGSGGGDNTNAGGGSGCSGTGGGVIYLAARNINRGASTAISAISAKGQTAGASAAGVAGTAGGGGGSGGGGGGYIYILCENLVGATATSALDVSGGAGGDGGNGVSTGQGGDGGNGGSGGSVDIIVLSTGTYSHPLTADTAGTAGTAHSGATKGTGGAGRGAPADL